MIPLWKAGPALACSNAFVLKPSERDPTSVPVRLARLFISGLLPAGVFQVVHDKEAVDAILHHPDIKAVGFVGSSDIARRPIYAGAAATGSTGAVFQRYQNHMIVMPDADLDQAVDADRRRMQQRRRTLHGDGVADAGGRSDRGRFARQADRADQ